MRSALLVLTIAGFGSIVGCSTLTPTDDPVYLRLQDLDARLGRIEKVVNNQSLVQLANQVDQLQADTKELRGEIDTLQHDTETSADRQRQLYLDVDRRLQALEQAQGRGAYSPQGAAGGSQPGGATGNAFASQPGGAGSGPAGFGGAANGGAGGGGAAQQGASQGGNAASGGSAGGPGAQPQVSGTDQDNYQAAFNLLQARRYPDAAKAFESFLAAFPQSPLADNAQYWLAETHYVQRDFTGALPEFQKVVDMYPQSSKIPDALLKVGYCNYELKQWDQARAALQKVAHDYPDTTAARLAQQRLERIAQQAG